MPKRCFVCNGLGQWKCGFVFFGQCTHAVHTRCFFRDDGRCPLCYVNFDNVAIWQDARKTFIADRRTPPEANRTALVHLLHSRQMWSSHAADAVLKSFRPTSLSRFASVSRADVVAPELDRYSASEKDGFRAAAIASVLGMKTLAQWGIAPKEAFAVHRLMPGSVFHAFAAKPEDVADLSYDFLFDEAVAESSAVAGLCDFAFFGHRFESVPEKILERCGANHLKALDMPYYRWKLNGLDTSTLAVNWALLARDAWTELDYDGR